MAASIRDPRVLARTITIYGSVDAVCEPLGITSRENVSIRIVRRDGTVLWGCTGAVTDELNSGRRPRIDGKQVERCLNAPACGRVQFAKTPLRRRG